MIFPAGKVVPRITRSTCAASTSSLPIPFCTVATQPSANACAVARIAGSVCIAFVATMPKSQAGSSAASVVARGRPTTSPAPVRRSPSRLIASTCSCARSYAQTSTSSSVARFAANSDPTAPQPTTHTFMSQLASLALISRSIVLCSGTGTPSRSASRTSAPVIMSTSVRRRASTSSSIDGVVGAAALGGEHVHLPRILPEWHARRLRDGLALVDQVAHEVPEARRRR